MSPCAGATTILLCTQVEALEILDLTEPDPELEPEAEAAPEFGPEFLQLDPEAASPLQESSYEAFEGNLDSMANRQGTDAQHTTSTAQGHDMGRCAPAQRTTAQEVAVETAY